MYFIEADELTRAGATESTKPQTPERQRRMTTKGIPKIKHLLAVRELRGGCSLGSRPIRALHAANTVSSDVVGSASLGHNGKGQKRRAVFRFFLFVLFFFFFCCFFVPTREKRRKRWRTG